MARPTQRRGLQTMRTQGTRKAGALTSPEMYIRLTSLEMERSRRVMERDRLLERVRILDQRIVQIAQEQVEMRSRLDVLDEQHRGDTSAAPHDSSRSDSGFGFTY